MEIVRSRTWDAALSGAVRLPHPRRPRPTAVWTDLRSGAQDDRRVRKTTQALIQALVDLSLARGYGAITVQDLLDWTDVG